FYPDASRPFGANNRLFPSVAMPNVFAPMAHDGALDGTVQDVVYFLEYVAEPARLIRYRIGIGVIFFLCIVGCLLYQCKRPFE
ncbi:MAG TPA: cytochrome c1, partial [Legionella sp.]|nr:cytochrome c1 [Legionella sp.]